MHIPPGYMQINWLFAREGDSELMLTSWAAEIAAFDDVNGPDDLFLAWQQSDMRTITTDATSLVRVECVVGTSDPSAPITLDSVSASNPGGAAEDALPNNCALLVKKVTIRGGRRGRGRCFYPDLQQDRVSETGLVGGANLSGYQDAWNDWVTAVEAVTGIVNLVLLHSDAADGDPDTITNWVVQGKIATQRRRMRP